MTDVLPIAETSNMTGITSAEAATQLAEPEASARQEHPVGAESSLGIAVENLGKRFNRRRADHPRTFKEAVLCGPRDILHRRRAREAEEFWALRDISFSIPKGRMVGIVGPNGAGKSTLLRLIGGIGRADEGSVTVNGRIGALLELGSGFQPDLTGRENVYVSGVIAGLTRHEIAQRFGAIVDFAELEAFIDSPLRTYSTGMQMRLGFAVAVHTDPDILLIDEVLAVGDLAFQRKCLERIEQFKARGCTILLVSHDAHSIEQLCDEALWLRRGQLIAMGPPEVVTRQYVEEMSVETQRRTPTTAPNTLTPSGAELRINENRFGSLECKIVAVRLLDHQGYTVTELDSGDPLQVKIEFLAPEPIESPIFGVTISQEDGTVCYDAATDGSGYRLPTLHGPGRISLHLDRLDLIGTRYYVDVGIYERDWTYTYDYHWHVYPLIVRPTPGEKGILRPPHRWQLERSVSQRGDHLQG
jgi:lipopolysaccharide transport system ATP-binding protein